MRIIVSILTIFILADSCETPKAKAVPSQQEFDTLPLPIDSTTFYFKIKGSWKDKTPDALDSFVNQWYSKMLFNMKEPILSIYKGDKEIIRFTWLRSFHHPVSIRIEKQGDNIKLFVKVCNGAGGYKPGCLIFDTTIFIKRSEYDLLRRKVDAIDFWNLATENKDNEGEDGSEWIIEAFKDNKYHMVTRWSPRQDREGTFRTVGEYMVSLSKISKNETQYFY